MNHYLIQTAPAVAERPNEATWQTEGDAFTTRTVKAAFARYDLHVERAHAGVAHAQRRSYRLLNIWNGGQREVASDVIHLDALRTQEARRRAARPCVLCGRRHTWHYPCTERGTARRAS